MSNTYWVYMMTNKRRTTLYTGMTNDLPRRLDQHRKGEGSKFTSRYNLQHLVYYEEFGNPREAIAREKRIKSWSRKWKDELVERDNPHWLDLGVGMYR
jgi:putative endonuclease